MFSGFNFFKPKRCNLYKKPCVVFRKLNFYLKALPALLLLIYVKVYEKESAQNSEARASGVAQCAYFCHYCRDAYSLALYGSV